MPVSDLAREVKMSYMGVKQHCLTLRDLGYLEEWRVPRAEKEVGRPEKLYRLTAKCDPLFPEAGVSMTLAVLEGVKEMFGQAAPEKVLFHHFRTLRDDWQPKLRAGRSLVEKATRLVDLRNRAGWFEQCRYDAENGFRIEEFHTPLARIYEVYPNAVRMELQMLEQLLGTKVERRELATGKGRRRVIYEMTTLRDPASGKRESGRPERS
jgi:predicted ArsR family transcriptional regulator